MKTKEIMYRGFKIVGKEYNYKVFRFNHDGSVCLLFTSCDTIDEVKVLIDNEF